MDHSDFEVGAEFTCSGRTFRVTDIGTRVIVAIRVDATEISTRFPDGRVESSALTRAEAETMSLFDGPPYGTAEIVFDEDDMIVCEPV